MITNAGNLVTFFDRKTDQWRYRYGHSNWGILAHEDDLLPFQIYSDVTVSSWSFKVYDLSDTEIHTIPIGNFEEHCDDTSDRKWWTYLGNGIGTTLDCGFYYVKADFDGAEQFSEVFHVVGDTRLAESQVHRLQAWNTLDRGTVLYSEGYKQHVFLDCYFQHPEIERDEVNLNNGLGGITLASAITKERTRIDSPYFHDNWLYAMTRIEDVDNLILKRMETMEEFSMNEFEFDSRVDSGGLFSVGLLSFRSQLFARTGCDEDFAVTACPSS